MLAFFDLQLIVISVSFLLLLSSPLLCCDRVLGGFSYVLFNISLFRHFSLSCHE